MIICQTPFRVSFFGGGTDWPEFFSEHRGAVLGTAIDKYVFHAAAHFPSQLFDYSIRLAYRKVERVQSVDDIEHVPFRAILKDFGIDRDIEIDLMADLPSFSGIGSSSSFTVGLINTLAAFQGRFLSKHDLCHAAIRIEREVLKESVGCQDQVFAAFGGLNVVEFRGLHDIVVDRVVINPSRLEELNASLHLVFTGVTRRAGDVERDKMARIRQTAPVLHEMLKLVECGHAVLTGAGPLSALGHLLHKAWCEKKALSPRVSNDEIDQLYNLAMQHGALGGKLLGAGGGGFMLFFVPPDRQQRLRTALASYPTVDFKVNAPGSHIVHS
jgi:D-glycero-alpha-D-manno-heptose-7-phosphate kinase